MKQNFDACFAKVIKSEGGYVNDPADRGGETNLGVTIDAWGAYLKRAIQPGEMKALKQEAVKPDSARTLEDTFPDSLRMTAPLSQQIHPPPLQVDSRAQTS